MLIKYYFIALLMLLLVNAPLQAQSTCSEQGVWLQVLGSGGPELDDGRASSGYVIWLNGKARILLDMGAGSLLHFEQSGAMLNDLDVVLLSHLHVDHSNDLPALIKAAYFSDRNRDLPLYGPNGNSLMPATTAFVQKLFAAKGAYRYLSDYLDGSESFRLLPHDVDVSSTAEYVVKTDMPYGLTAVAVHHGPVPALAWRVEIAGRSLVFSGDMNNQNNVLSKLAKQADLLLAHHAIPEQAGSVARNLHMPPSVIGQIASKAEVKQLVLSHRMNRTLGREKAATAQIRQSYKGTLHFADDLQCFRP
ncbi:MAG: MBL fold metallo-hydrolase [Gammaproteobacteria bacterium]